jgi:peptide methionine sulfoxide reductase msrA/msrB
MIRRIMKGLVAVLLVLPLSAGFSADAKHEMATFAGGCFWCMDAAFEDLPGVINVITGYTGGHTENPTYDEVSAGRTGHAEAIQVTYDPAKITYSELLDAFWKQIDPTDRGGQMVERGSQYRTVIFYHTEEQKLLAELTKKALEESGRFDRPIITEITKATKFYPAEEYHQHYFKKNRLAITRGAITI